MTEIEIELQDNRKGIKIRLKGEQAAVDSYLQKYGYDEALKVSVTQTPTGAAPQPDIPMGNLEVPEKPQAESLREYVLALMYGTWGAPGRNSSEILEVARAHGVGLTINTLSGTLHVLTSLGKLSRTRKPGETQWIYFPPLSRVTGSEQASTGTT